MHNKILAVPVLHVFWSFNGRFRDECLNEHLFERLGRILKTMALHPETNLKIYCMLAPYRR